MCVCVYGFKDRFAVELGVNISPSTVRYGAMGGIVGGGEGAGGIKDEVKVRFITVFHRLTNNGFGIDFLVYHTDTRFWLS